MWYGWKDKKKCDYESNSIRWSNKFKLKGKFEVNFKPSIQFLKLFNNIDSNIKFKYVKFELIQIYIYIYIYIFYFM